MPDFTTKIPINTFKLEVPSQFLPIASKSMIKKSLSFSLTKLSKPKLQLQQGKQVLNLPSNSTSFSWNIHLISLTNANQHHSSISLYQLMLHPPNPLPNSFTFPSVLRSSTSLSIPILTPQIHSHAVKLNCEGNTHVLTSLISSYSRLSNLSSAHRVLSERISLYASSIDTLVVCYNALISGYAFHSLFLPTFSLFRDMIRARLPFNNVTVMSLLPCMPSIFELHALLFRSGFVGDVAVSNCVISGYARCGEVVLARKVFDEMGDIGKDIVSYNAIISCYVRNGLGSEVLELYYEIRKSCRVEPDPVTLVGVLSACANLGAHALGQEIECDIRKNSLFGSNIYLNNALINMHARCGDLKKASEIFHGMQEKTLVSWTAIITGFGAHGDGRKALEHFEQMLANGVRPDAVVMVSVLSACSHSGLADEGLEYFANMERKFGIVPDSEHYACIVDLLGRAGRLNEAWELIESMPVARDGGIWGALLGACKIHKNVELGKLAFDHLVEIEPTNVGYYVLMTNIYLDAGKLDEVVMVRALMKQRGLKKEPGCSYVEINGKMHLFMADDHSHPLAKSIYQMINKLESLVHKERKVKVVGFHSEKLAVAFGFLSTEAGVDIVVIKNLRVCEDCHSFLKMVSTIVSRKLVVRDATRFHHFEEGLCSCNDYW